MSEHDLATPLKRIFGFDSFRPYQEEIIRSIMGGRDAFVVMPTGGGKSLCYQLPAHLLPGTCIVISPLISLMKDQVDAARAAGVRAECFNSSLSASQRSGVLAKVRGGVCDILYVSPERFAMESFFALLESVQVCLFAVDEAHCISEWGHDFRPDYLTLSTIAQKFPTTPVAAFTATATHRVQQDTIDKLFLRDPHTVRASFNRPNLFYRVVQKDRVDRQVLEFLKTRSGDPGIVYRTTRDSVQKTAKYLTTNGFEAIPYHAGLDNETRRTHQDAFNRDEVGVIVATIAFGMGIDKSNVRFVLHGDLPKNIESYYQETGRAGRDGEPADCVLFLSLGDIPKIRYFIDRMDDDVGREIAAQKLNQMVRYASVNACRRRQLLAYFGESYGEERCGSCDVCLGEVEQADASVDAQMLMSAVLRTGQRFGATHIVDVVVGADTQRIRDLRHDAIKTYGVGRAKDKRYWRNLVDEMIAQDCLVRTDDRYPVLHLTQKGGSVLRGEQSISILKRQETGGRKPPAEAKHDRLLFEELRALRRTIADRQGVPPFIVFSDRTLREMATLLPTTAREMNRINGVGERKLERYGNEFIAAIRSFGDSQPNRRKK